MSSMMFSRSVGSRFAGSVKTDIPEMRRNDELGEGPRDLRHMAHG